MWRLWSVLFLLALGLCSSAVNCEKNASAPVQRDGRQLDIPRDVRLVRFFMDGSKHMRRPPLPPQMSPRSDHFPQRLGPGPGPGPFGRPPFGRLPIPHMRRRVHTGPGGPPPPGVYLRSNGPPPPQFANYPGLKNGRFPLAKGPYVQKGGPVNFYRQTQGPGSIQNLNAIPQGPNFKPSPIYNGEVIVRRPSAAPLVAAPPLESSSQSHSSKPEEKLDALRFYKSNAVPDLHMYSVYEDTDSDADESFPPHHNIGESAMKEAKQFLNFMSSNEYFLPKLQPDYRKMEQEQQQKLQEVESVAAAALSAYQQQQRNADQSNHNAAFTVNAPLQVSASASQPQASNGISPTSTFPNRHPAQTNFGSYQADNNLFVVSSDGMKNVHHVVSTPSFQDSNQQPLSMPTFSSELRPMLKERLPDPERVEFTERDAIHVSYTSSPMESMSRYNEQQQQQQQKQQELQQSYASPTGMQEDEDDEMMQSASDVYGRVKVNSSKSSPNPTIEQKDTEEYCERICSNVQDDDEEIVCGSDGYMYTSEAQMECYASCLHIDVTIQSKGTCNQSL